MSSALPELDRIDLKILNCLQEDGRISNLKLAETVTLSPTAVLARVQRLTKEGYILGYEARLNPLKLGAGMMVFVEVLLDKTTPNVFEAFKAAAANEPLNRLPWVEIARIQRTHQENPEAAIHTLRTALESQEWQVNDAAYLLFRLAELYDEDRDDRTTAVSIMQQVIEEFPETRHSANARHKLRAWGIA
jgi:DNA-binding Lrp family transcriptional regulator